MSKDKTTAEPKKKQVRTVEPPHTTGKVTRARARKAVKEVARKNKPK